MRHVFEHRWLDELTIARSAAKQATTLLDRTLNRLLDSHGVVLRNHRSNESLFVVRVADGQGTHGIHEFFAERVVDVAVDKDPLNADAALASLIIAAEYAAFHGIFEVRIFIDKRGRIAA